MMRGDRRPGGPQRRRAGGDAVTGRGCATWDDGSARLRFAPCGEVKPMRFLAWRRAQGAAEIGQNCLRHGAEWRRLWPGPRPSRRRQADYTAKLTLSRTIS